MQLAHHAYDRHESLEWGDAFQARIEKLDMNGVNGRLVPGGVECDPALIDVNLIPHVEAKTIELVDIQQPDRDASGNSHGPAHRGGENGVFGAVAAHVPGDFVRRGERDLEILIARSRRPSG